MARSHPRKRRNCCTNCGNIETQIGRGLCPNCGYLMEVGKVVSDD